MTLGERIEAIAPTITIRIDSGGMFISTHRGIYHGYSYTPVEIGRDENGVARDVSVFADVDAQTPKLVT
jgi:hypothetical protein